MATSLTLVKVGPRAWVLTAALAALVAGNQLMVRTMDAPLSAPGPWTLERTVHAAAELAPDATCALDAGIGDVKIVASAGRRGEIHARIRATAADPRAAALAVRQAAIAMEATPHGLRARVPVTLPDGVVVDLAVSLPAQVPVTVKGVAGHTELAGVGPASVETAAGAIDLTAPAGAFALASRSGPVTVTLMREPRQAGRVRTITGDVHVRAQFEAPAGKAVLTFPLNVVAHSQNGRVDAPAAEGTGPSLEVDSVDGDVAVEALR